MVTASLLPLISSVITVFLGVLIFLTNKDDKVNRLFLFFSISISLGLFSTFMMFENSKDIFTILFWDKLVYVGVVFIPVAMYHFGLTILNIKEKYTNILLKLGYTLALFFLVMIPTDYFIKDVFIYKWGAHTKAQFLHHFFLVYFFSYLLLWLFLTYRGYKSEDSMEEKKKLKLVLISFLILTGVGSFGFLPAYEIPIYPISYISGIIFVVILSYAILKHHLFNIRLVLVEIAVLLLNLFFLVNAVASYGGALFIIDVAVFIFVAILSILLMRAINKDIRDRERIEKLIDDVKIANELLRTNEEQKTEFVSIASHQLRAPLTAIKGYASMILEGTFGQLLPDAREAMGKLYKSNEKVLSIVEDLLTVSRIEQGRMVFNLEVVNLSNFVNTMIGELRDDAKDAKIIIHFMPDSHSNPLVLIDTKKFKQVVRHILENAIQYTKAGGSVKVEIQNDRVAGKARLLVSDTGVGMTPEQISSIFERSKMKLKATSEAQIEAEDNLIIGNSSIKEAEEIQKNTTGIGLYIVQEIIEAHHGTLQIESSGLDRGTTVTVELPMTEEYK